MDITTANIRNAQYTGSPECIDCEIEHPEFGWIPFTASSEDCEAHGRAIHARIVSGEAGEIAAYIPPEPICKTCFSAEEFLDRLTEDEQLAVVSAAMQDPVVKLWYDRMLIGSSDVDCPKTKAALDHLVTTGVLEAYRKDELLQPEYIPVE